MWLLPWWWGLFGVQAQAGGDVTFTTLIDLLAKGSSIVLAVVIVLMIFGWLVPGPIYKDALSREKALGEKLDAAQKVIADTAGLADEMMAELKKRRRTGGA